MSKDSKHLERASPTPCSEIAPQGSPPAHIPEINPKPFDTGTLLGTPSPYQVQNLVINDGDSNIVALYRIKEHVKKLTEAYNKLVEHIRNRELAKERIFVDEIQQFTQDDLQIVLDSVKVPKNSTFDVVGWLYSIRYTCNCVASVPYWGRYTYWCNKCNRLVLEND